MIHLLIVSDNSTKKLHDSSIDVIRNKLTQRERQKAKLVANGCSLEKIDVESRVQSASVFQRWLLSDSSSSLDLDTALELHHLPRDDSLDSIRKVMSKDGWLILTTPNRDSLHCRIYRKLGLGVHQTPYWTLESVIGKEIRNLTDNDYEVNAWMNDIARHAPARHTFIKCHKFSIAA